MREKERFEGKSLWLTPGSRKQQSRGDLESRSWEALVHQCMIERRHARYRGPDRDKYCIWQRQMPALEEASRWAHTTNSLTLRSES